MSNDTAPPTPGSWVVVSQTPGPGQDSTGALAQGYTISIRTGLGNSGQLFVPTAKYLPEQVRPLLAELASRIDAVAQMSG